jgi:hypothetical protein
VSPERILAALLGTLAAGLVALLVLGPTEGVEAKTDPPQATAAPATTTSPAPETTTAPLATTAPETEPGTTEPAPSPPAPRPGDGTFPTPVTFALDYPSEVDWSRHELRAKVPELRLEARATAVRGGAGDVHGLECTGRSTYTFVVDPWNGTYELWQSNQLVQSGAAPGLVEPPRPNELSLVCEARNGRTTLSLRANGELVTTWMDGDNGARLTAVALTAWSPSGGEEVVFDGVVLETG